MQDVDRFWSVNLATGAARFIGNTPNPLFAISAAPAGTAVPEPATSAMLLMGFGGVGALIRRKRRGRRSIAYA